MNLFFEQSKKLKNRYLLYETKLEHFSEVKLSYKFERTKNKFLKHEHA
jgi:hypothetical protein